MKQFLCLKDLVMDNGERSLTAGKLYQSCEKNFTGVWNEDGISHYAISLYGSWVETFEQDGETWISVPEFKDEEESDDYYDEILGFTVIFMTSNGELSEPYVIGCGKTNSLYGKYGSSYETKAYRIISTGEPEQVVRGDVLHFTQQESQRYADHVLGGLEEMLQKEKDSRPLSPQEAAYAEKVAAMQPEPEQVKEFPQKALRDMSDKTFANLLGMGQFIGDEE